MTYANIKGSTCFCASAQSEILSMDPEHSTGTKKDHLKPQSQGGFGLG